jgi:hypothetical protein
VDFSYKLDGAGHSLASYYFSLQQRGRKRWPDGGLPCPPFEGTRNKLEGVGVNSLGLTHSVELSKAFLAARCHLGDL